MYDIAKIIAIIIAIIIIIIYFCNVVSTTHHKGNAKTEKNK